MLSMLKNYKGNVEINGVHYDSINEAISHYTAKNGAVSIRLTNKRDLPREKKQTPIESINVEKKITVKAYMTRPATVDFDFMERYNNNIPMPLRTMVGTVVKETPGMVYMNLHGDITSERTMYCMKCRRQITNPVSQYFGMGPECGGHNYVNPFYSKEELQRAVVEYKKKLKEITWSGWVIKSAIIEEEIIENGTN